MPLPRDPLAGLTRPEATLDDGEIIDLLVSRPASDWAVLTGAGLSTDSGIPDYRGPRSPRRSPMTIDLFLSSDLQRRHYWARSWVGFARVARAEPNAGHLALAALGPAVVVTQNVDGLHEAAGSDPVIDLHGRLDRVLCLQCRRIFDRAWVQSALTAANPDFLAGLELDVDQLETAPDGDVELARTSGFRIVDCPQCGGILKPDVVFFGESVPADRNRRATDAVAEAAGLVVLGTSLAVFSGLRFVKAAIREGKPVVVVTDGPTRADPLPVHRSVSRTSPFLVTWREAAGSRGVVVRDRAQRHDVASGLTAVPDGSGVGNRVRPATETLD